MSLEGPTSSKSGNSRINQGFCLLLTLVVTSAGCASYRFGHRSLYRPDVRTVHVPVFQSESLRQNLGERLTEAVVKEIELRTPYKVVSTPDADSVLSGRILRETKHVEAETRYDDAREIATDFVVQAQWISRQNEFLMRRCAIPLGGFDLTVTQNSTFIPEAGQSLATAQQQAIERAAREIVGQMEIWW